MTEKSIFEFAVSIMVAIITFFTLGAWIFPTKEKVNKDCQSCRKDLYEAIDKKSDCSDTQKMDTKLDNLAVQINSINISMASVVTILNERHCAKNDESKL